MKKKIAAERAEQAAKRAEIENIYHDFINGEGRLPEGFSEKYNRTIKSGYIFHETPFEEYLHEMMPGSKHSVFYVRTSA